MISFELLVWAMHERRELVWSDRGKTPSEDLNLIRGRNFQRLILPWSLTEMLLLSSHVMFWSSAWQTHVARNFLSSTALEHFVYVRVMLKWAHSITFSDFSGSRADTSNLWWLRKSGVELDGSDQLDSFISVECRICWNSKSNCILKNPQDFKIFQVYINMNNMIQHVLAYLAF